MVVRTRDRRRAALASLAAAAVLTVAACSSSTTVTPTSATPAASPVPPSTDQRAPESSMPSTAPATTTTTTTATSTIAPTVAPTPPTTAAPTTVPGAVPVVEAAAYAVFDQRTGTLLAGSEADTGRPVGSLMKLLVAEVVYRAGAPEKVVVAPEGLVLDPMESIVGITPGQLLPRDVLTRAMLIVSANDAARALAIDVAGSEPAMAEQMNAVAASLGLVSTHAVNVSGLDAEGQYSTANDMVRLGAFLMGRAQFQLTVERRDATLNDQTLPATNDLLGLYPGADGIKTGHTTQAGWCILASADRAGRRIIVAVLGAPTEEARNAAATALLDWGFTR